MRTLCPLERAYGHTGNTEYCNRPSYTGPRRFDLGEGWCETHLREWGWLPEEDDDVS